MADRVREAGSQALEEPEPRVSEVGAKRDFMVDLLEEELADTRDELPAATRYLEGMEAQHLERMDLEEEKTGRARDELRTLGEQLEWTKLQADDARKPLMHERQASLMRSHHGCQVRLVGAAKECTSPTRKQPAAVVETKQPRSLDHELLGRQTKAAGPRRAPGRGRLACFYAAIWRHIPSRPPLIVATTTYMKEARTCPLAWRATEGGEARGGAQISCKLIDIVLYYTQVDAAGRRSDMRPRPRRTQPPEGRSSLGYIELLEALEQWRKAVAQAACSSAPACACSSAAVDPQSARSHKVTRV
jgi:hypothetical protein